MRALLTGSHGFLGHHFGRHLHDAGWEIDGIDIHWGDDCLAWFATKHWGQGLGDWGAGFDLVVHCAAVVDGRERIEHDAAKVCAYNAMLDSAMFDWALRAKPGRIIYISSSAVYPANRHNMLQEPSHETEGGPGSPGLPDQGYGWAKLHGEMLAGLVRQAGVAVTIVRPFSVYRPDQANCYPFPAMIGRAILRQDPFTVWGDGKQVRDFIHVDDAIRAILAVAEHGFVSPVNIGTGVATSMDELARLAMKVAGYEAPIEHMSDKPQGVRYRVADPNHMRMVYEPRVSLEQGVQEAIHGR